MLIYTTPEYKALEGVIKKYVLGLMIEFLTDSNKTKKLKTYLSETLGIVNPQVFNSVLNNLKDTKPSDLESYFNVIEKRLLINSFPDITKMLETSYKLREYVVKNLNSKSTLIFCNLLKGEK